MSKSIGFIGLGVLGSAMAANLLKEGFRVSGYDIRPEASENLKNLGLTAGSSPKDIADKTEVVITCLPTISSLHDVYTGKDGLHKSSQFDQILLETSTLPVAEKKEHGRLYPRLAYECWIVL